MLSRALPLVLLARSAAAQQLTLDTHVHISNTWLLQYPWANASLGVPCPAAPPALCNWTLADHAAATAAQPSSKVVFVEVAVAPEQWLVEARWVQGLADAGGAGAVLGAIVAQPPPGFGSPGADLPALEAALDSLAALPLARGVRGSALNFSDAAALPTAIAHTRLLAARRLSLDVITNVGAPGAADGILALARAVPEATLILDHVGEAPVLGPPAGMDDWRAAMQRLGAQPNIYCKLGGIFQFFKATQTLPTVDQVRPLVETTVRAFGYEKSVYEANWFFVNWIEPPRLDVASLWIAMLRDILDGMGATRQQRDEVYALGGARAYRVQL